MKTEWIIVGGTGQTGHRCIESIFSSFIASTENIVATSRVVENSSTPTGELAQTIAEKNKVWSTSGKLSWVALDLSLSDESILRKQWESLKKNLRSNDSEKKLIITAAYTNVDGCEIEPERCMLSNFKNVSKICEWAKFELNAFCCFISTDYVFDGKNGPYQETIKRSAESVYGQSKVFMEEWMEKSLRDYLIVRTTGVYDALPGSKNFFMQMIMAAKNKTPYRVPKDQIANPVWAKELAQATVELCEKNCIGIFNVAGAQQLARTEFAYQILDHWNFSRDHITAVETKDLGQKAKRPLKGGLICEKLKETLGWAPRTPKEVFKEKEFKNVT